MPAEGQCSACGEPIEDPEGWLADPTHVRCDICDGIEHPADLTPDWNGETGCHLSCQRSLA